MVPDPNRPEKLLAVANAIEAAAITTALAETRAKKGGPGESRENTPAPQASSLTVKLALVTSFILISAVGGALFLIAVPRAAWATPTAVVVLFIAIMAAVHWIGYLAWRRQQRQLSESGVQSPQLSKSLVSALKDGVILQFVLLVLPALVVDGSVEFCFAVIIGHLAGIGIIAVRRGAAPTTLDLLFTRYGAIFLALAAISIAMLRAEFLARPA